MKETWVCRRPALAACALAGLVSASPRLSLAAGAPVVSGIVPAAGSSLSSLSEITVTFSSPVVGVDSSDLLINGQAATVLEGLVGSSMYSFSFTQPVPGTVLVDWNESHGITELGGVPFEQDDPGASWSYTLIDTVAPQVAGILPMPEITVSRLTQVEISFAEPVLGVDAADLLVNGMPATHVKGAGSGPYVFSFASPESGTVTFSWDAGHGITDMAAIPNDFNGGSWSNTLDPLNGMPTIRISEIMTANVSASGLTDQFGNLQDWIEIHNYGSDPVNLAGCSLSDTAAYPGKWIFPSKTLAPGAYLVVFASGLNMSDPANPLHAGFSLSSGGEYLGLYSAESPRTLLDGYDYPEQRNDISYGIDGFGQRVYFTSPTPGAANDNSPIAGVVEPVHFSVGRGFFADPFSLLITTPTPGATIRYTLDGSLPTTSHGTVYSGPLSISGTTTLRAVAYKANLLPTRVETHSFIFPEQVLNQSADPPGFPTEGTWSDNTSAPDYEMDPDIVDDPQYSSSLTADLLTLPTLSIVMNTEDMFGSSGIYPNYRLDTIEKPCSIEMIYSDGSRGMQIDAGIELHGGGSRYRTIKHSFGLKFRGVYGYGKLEYPLFPDTPAASFDSLVLRADYNNHWVHSDSSQRSRGGLIRDAMIKDTLSAMGALSSHGTYVHLYINGLYWGVYNPCEDLDASFPVPYYGGEAEDYDSIRWGEGATTDGNTTAYNAMLSLNNSGLAGASQYAQIQQYLDPVQYADYLILEHYAANQDWGSTKNWGAIRKREPGAQFKYLPWDNERTFESVSSNVTGTSPNGLQSNLMLNSEYRMLFADRVHRHLFNDGALTPEHAEQLWMKRSGMIHDAMAAESARWGDAMSATLYTRNIHFLTEQDRLLTTYFPYRTANLLGQYRSRGYYPATAAPEFNRFGGRVEPGFSLEISAAAGTIYYTTNGIDPRVPISGGIAPEAIAYAGPVTMRQSVPVKARVWSGAEWSALTEAEFTVGSLGVPLRITEIMYNPQGGNAYEFVEIQNVGAHPLDLGGCSFEGITFVFRTGTILPPGAVLVIANNLVPADFASRYPGVYVSGYFNGALDNSGERIAILDSDGSTVTSVTYDDDGGWPLRADGGGYSLEVIDPLDDPDSPANWRESLSVNGSPGQPSGPPVPGDVVINEIAAENLGSVINDGLYPDWIELHNRSAQAVSLLNWSISDSGNAQKFVLPDILLQAGEYLVIWCDDADTAPGLHAGFSLERDGESIFLYDASTNRIDAVSFGAQIGDLSLGRIHDAWTLTIPSPGALNSPAPLGSPSEISINEWMADAPPGEDDWIELYNRSPALPVDLRGLYLSTSNAVHRIRSHAFLGPESHILMRADEAPGPDHVDFKLPSIGGSILLSDYSGLEVEQVTYGFQDQAVSEGRLPDGTDTFSAFPLSASPGAANYLPAWTGPRLNEVLARNNRAELSPWNEYADWIEIRNPGSSAFNLSGMGLGDSANASARWIFPDGSTVPGYGYLRIWCDGSRSASTDLSAALNTGFSLSGDDGEVCLFNGAGQMVDSVGYGFQLRDKSIGLDGDTWMLLESPTPGTANTAAAPLADPSNLRFNEWMASPLGGDDWFELYNSATLPVSLGGLYLTDDPSIMGRTQYQISPLSFIGAGKWVRWIADGQPGSGRDHVNFNLDGNGETLRLYDAATNLLEAVDFGLQEQAVSEGRLPDGADAVVPFPVTPTPGDANYLPSSIVINEVLSHTDAPFEDAIELYNADTVDIDIGGWYLSDSANDLKRYRIPDGTVIPAGGFKVFYQVQFGPADGESDIPPLFSFNSAHGDAVYLSAVDGAGHLTGLRAQTVFGAAANGVSFGRYLTSTGVEFVAMDELTFGMDSPASLEEFRTGSGSTNAYPKVGPVVISEIMYHPADDTANTASVAEFIELHNTGASSVPLYDPSNPSNVWHLANAVEFGFPSGTSIPAYGTLVVVPFDPMVDAEELAAFRTTYGSEAILAGPFTGELDNSGDRVELWRPDAPQAPPHPDAGFVPQILVERVAYSDAAPWPAAADGQGASLQRIALAQYANDPANWDAADPTAGQAGPEMPGPPVITQQPLSQAAYPGETVEFSVSATGVEPLNYQWMSNSLPMSGEAGTSLVFSAVQPGQAAHYQVMITNLYGTVESDMAYLSVAELPVGVLYEEDGHSPELVFTVLPHRFYQVEYRTNLLEGIWMPYGDPSYTIDSELNAGPVATNDVLRFYRLKTLP